MGVEIFYVNDELHYNIGKLINTRCCVVNIKRRLLNLDLIAFHLVRLVLQLLLLQRHLRLVRLQLLLQLLVLLL